MKTRGITILATSLGFLAFAAIANAQERPRLLTDLGMGAEVGGGVFGFTDTKATDATDPGGSWTARVMIGTRTHLGFEAAYLGTAQAFRDVAKLDGGAYLLSNGVEGIFRLNILTDDWQPYAFVGGAYRRYQVEGTVTKSSSINDKNDIGEVPFGIGVAYRYAGFVADLRAEYRPAFGSALFVGANDNSLSIWSGSARVGWEF